MEKGMNRMLGKKRSLLRNARNAHWPGFLAALLFLGACLLCLCCGGGVLKTLAADAVAATIRLARTEGSVDVLDSVSKKSLIKADNMRLASGTRVRTESASYAWLSLDEDKAVKEDENSEIEVRKKGKKLEVLLEDGNLFFNVTKPLEADEVYSIRTSTMVMGIRGTAGVVKIIDGTRARVSILDGSVTCNVTNQLAGQTKSVVLKPGQQADFLVYEPEKQGDKCDIIMDGVSVGDVDGFVLEEVAKDARLAERIYVATEGGLDLRDVTPEAARARLEEDQQATSGKISVIREAERVQEEQYRERQAESNDGNSVEKVPYWERVQRPETPVDKTSSDDSSDDSSDGSGGSGGSGGSEETSDESIIRLTMPITATNVQGYLNRAAVKQVILRPGSGLSNNTLDVDIDMHIPSGKTLTTEDGVPVKVESGNSMKVDGTADLKDTLDNAGTIDVNSANTLKVGKNFSNTGTFRNNESGKSVFSSGIELQSGSLVNNGSLQGAPEVKDGAELVLEAGTVSGNLTVSKEGAFSLNGGTLNGSLTMESGTVTISGGTVSGDAELSGGTFTMKGGTLKGSLTMESGTVTLNGGKVSGDTELSDGTFTMKGGTLEGALSMEGGTATLSGGTLSGDAAFTDVALTMNGGAVKGAVSLYGTASISMKKGSKITYSGSSAALSLEEGCTASFGGGTVTNDGAGLALSWEEGGETPDPGSTVFRSKTDKNVVLPAIPGYAAKKSGNYYVLNAEEEEEKEEEGYTIRFASLPDGMDADKDVLLRIGGESRGISSASAEAASDDAGKKVEISLQVDGANADVTAYEWTIEDGDSKKITATASSDKETMSFTMPESNVSISISASNEQEDGYSIKCESAEHGSIKVSVDGGEELSETTAEEGQSVAIKWYPDSGYSFDSESLSVTTEAGDAVELKSDLSFAMPAADVTLSAVFVELSGTVYTVTIDSGITNGKIESLSATEAAEGETVTFKAVPNDGYALNEAYVVPEKGGEVDVTVSGTDCSFFMPADNVTISASFEEAEESYAVTIDSGITNGTIENLSATEAAEGDTVTFEVVPNDGYAVGEVSAVTAGGDSLELTLSGTEYSFTMVAEEVTLKASFIKSYTITLDSSKLAGSQFSLVDNDEATAVEGQTVTVKVEALQDYTYDQSLVNLTWSGGDEKGPLSSSDDTEGLFTFTMPAGDVTVTSSEAAFLKEFKLNCEEVYPDFWKVSRIIIEEETYYWSSKPPVFHEGDSIVVVLTWTGETPPSGGDYYYIFEGSGKPGYDLPFAELAGEGYESIIETSGPANDMTLRISMKS